LWAANTTATDREVIPTKITTIVSKIRTRIMIALKISNFRTCSKNQCTLENGEEDEEFDEISLTQAIARIVVGGVLKPKPIKRTLQPNIESKGMQMLLFRPF